MTTDEIVKYVFSTPENTNPNVLKSMLQQINSENGNQLNNNTQVIELHIDENKTLDMTWQEINDAWYNGTILYCDLSSTPTRSVAVVTYSDRGFVMTTYYDELEQYYTVYIASQYDSRYFVTSETSGYPTLLRPQVL